MIRTKTCKRCDVEKPRADFYAQKSGDGRMNACKECAKVAARAHRLKRVEYYREYDRRRDETPERKVQLRESAGRARDNPDTWAKRLAYRANWARTHPESRAASTGRYREANPVKIKAHRRVRYAIETGRLLQLPCEECGSEPAFGHHDDYAKPLDVRWLCAEHHSAWHRLHGEGANAA